MQIDKIEASGFGNLKNVNISLSPGLNVIKGKNETGKSTLVDFIKCSFYGISKNKNGKEFSDYERYFPWGNNEFVGNIYYETNDKKYSIHRDFSKNKAIVYDDSGNDISTLYNKDKSKGVDIGTELFNMDEETFESSILVKQNQIQVDGSKQNAIVQKLGNIIQTGDESISYDEIVKKIEKKIYDEIGTDRTSTKPKYILKKDIENLAYRKDELEKNRKRSAQIAEEKEIIANDISKRKAEIEKIKSVYEIKQKYEKETVEEKIRFDAEQKAKNEQRKIREKEQKQKKIVDTTLILIATIILAVAMIFINKYILIPVAIVVGIVAVILNLKISYKEEILADTNNFDLVSEEIRKKETKALTQLEKQGVKKTITELRISELKKYIEKLEEERNKDELEIHKYKLEEATIKSGLNELNDVIEDYNAKKIELEKISKKEEIYNLALKVLESSYEDIKKTIIPSIEEDINYTISKTTDKKYKDFKLNDKDGLVCKNDLGEIISLNKLSLGTIDQVYLGFRLAIAEKYENLPMIFDETFVYFDDKRLENILKMVSEIAKEKQVIILTCSNREVESLDKIKCDYNRIDL